MTERRIGNLMRLLRTTSKVGLAALVVLALPSCGQTSAAPPAGTVSAVPSSEVNSGPTSSPEPSPTKTLSAAPSTPIGPSGNFVAKMEDTDGYTFDLAVSLTTTDLGESVADDKPGFMSARFTLSLGMEMINTTPGRKLTFEGVSGVTKPLGNPKFLVSAVWDAGNPICLAAAKPDKACALIMGYGYADVPVPADGTVPLKAYKGEPSGHLTAGVAGVAEEDWPAIREALKEPAALLISYDGGKHQRFGCKGHHKLGALLAASTAGYECGTVYPEIVRLPTKG